LDVDNHQRSASMLVGEVRKGLRSRSNRSPGIILLIRSHVVVSDEASVVVVLFVLALDKGLHKVDLAVVKLHPKKCFKDLF
jgi:hypothetical protein